MSLSDDHIREMMEAARSYIGANGYDPDPQDIIDALTELSTLRSQLDALTAERDEARALTEFWKEDAGRQTKFLRTAEAQLARQGEALKPFALEAHSYDPVEDDDDRRVWDSRITLGNLRRARSALGDLHDQ